MKYFFWGAFVLLGCSSVFSQVNTPEQAMKALSKEPEPVGGLTGKTTYYVQEPATLSGLYGGVDFDGIVCLTASVNFVRRKNAPVVLRDKSYPGQKLLEYSSYRMSYLGLGAEYVFYRSKRWKLSVPLETGIGRYKIEKEFQADPLLPVVFDRESGIIIPFEGGFSASFYIWDWLALKAMLGNRITMGGGDANAVFSGPYWQYGILVFPSALYKEITGKPLRFPSFPNS